MSRNPPTTYLISAQGQRVKKSNAAETRLFVYDDAGHLLGEYDAAGIPVQELVWLGSIPVAVLGALPAQCVACNLGNGQFAAFTATPIVEICGGGRGDHAWKIQFAGNLMNLS